jgi:hypothetical protein
LLLLRMLRPKVLLPLLLQPELLLWLQAEVLLFNSC